MNIVIIVVIGWACHLAKAQEKVCSAFCSSLGMLQTNPGRSCNDIYKINKASRGMSGNYWINTTTGVHQVYCDMELECGGHKGGWMRIANFNASNGDDCPSGWTNISTPVAACVAPSDEVGCYSVDFPTFSTHYSRVCGRAVGYQSYTTDAFAALRFPTWSIDGPYVDGVSITYGTPRKHIWTYAIGFSERDGTQGVHCPCSESPGLTPPCFVHDNYYCESGRLSANSQNEDTSGVYVDDPVWDGYGCSDGNSCCAEACLPWFFRQIPVGASEDIETRICRDEESRSEDVLVRELQLLVQ